MIDFIIWLAFGALAGWIASMIMKTDGQMGAISNIVVGIIGAFIGGFIMRFLTGAQPEGVSIPGLIVAVIGAVILLAIVKAMSGRSVNA